MSSTTPQSQVDKERIDIIQAEIVTVKEQLANPKGLPDIEREKLLERLRMLFFFLEMLQWKDQPKVPVKDRVIRKQDTRSSNPVTRELLDKMLPPQPPAPDTWFNPQRKKRDRDPIDDLARNKPDFSFDPFSKPRRLPRRRGSTIYYMSQRDLNDLQQNAREEYRQKWDMYTGRWKQYHPEQQKDDRD